jgi:hypothetical protein
MKINSAFLLNYYQTCEEIGGMDSAINPFNVNQYDENIRELCGDEFEEDDGDEEE